MSYPSGYNPPGMSAYYNLPQLILPPPPPPPPPLQPSNSFPPVYQDSNSNQYYGNGNYNVQYLPPPLDISRPPPISSNFDGYGNKYPGYQPATRSSNVPMTDRRPVQYPILPQLDLSRPPPSAPVPTSYKSNRRQDRDYSASERSHEFNSKHYSHSQIRSRSTHSGSNRDYSKYEKSSIGSRKKETAERDYDQKWNDFSQSSESKRYEKSSIDSRRETVEHDYDQKWNDFSQSSESKDQRKDAKELSSRYAKSRYPESRRSRESSSYSSQSKASDRDNYSHNRRRDRSAHRHQDTDSKSRPRESSSRQRESIIRQPDRESSRKSTGRTGDRKEVPRKESRRHESMNRDAKLLPKKTLKDFETERNLEDVDVRRNDVCNNMEDVYDKIDQGPTDDESCEDEVLQSWCRSSPADQYYSPVPELGSVMQSTARGRKICEQFREKLLERGRRARPGPGSEPLQPPRWDKPRLCKHKTEQASSNSSSSSSEDSECDKVDHAMMELERKQQHPRRLHIDMWYNDSGEMNDGPLCRCSARTRRQGIRHGVYAMETKPPPCDPISNNADKLFHYRITISPPTNFLIKSLTVIRHDEHEFLFSGFSLLSHYPLTKLPSCKVIRFNIEYTIQYVEEQMPLNYTVEELELFEEFLFIEILELVDLDVGKRDANGCSQFHMLPRWERTLTGGGGEVLALCEVLLHLMRAGGELMPATALPALRAASEKDWQAFVNGVRGMIVTYPGKKPCSMRVDQLDRSLPDVDSEGDKCKGEKETEKTADSVYPEIVHFGIRPSQLSYAGNPEYKKAWRDYLKYRHLVANMAKPSYDDKRKLESKEARLQDMRTQSKMKRDVTIAVSAEGFYRTGLMCDVVQHAMLIPVLISHLRFHKSLQNLETTIDYRFENRALLQLALTHPSYRKNFGTNPDHARNSLTNCGIRQPEYGDRRIHYMNIRKRGINTLINIMSRFGKKIETESAINHNERLEFLGDAVVEFLSTIHLFRMFPSLEEGGLATYRAAIVQNQQLAVLARKLGLDQYMLYAHGSDLCHDLELRHAMANCFEALMGALFLDGGIDVADKVFALAMFADKPDLLETWNRPRLHVLQEQEPLGDRRWITKYPFLQKLTEFETAIGVEFKHIRLLARVFTDRSMGFTNLTLGSNQRLEFLGDTVLQLISSEYLYKHFPEHHEGHLSLLRSSLVNNRTQAVVCDDLAMCKYAVYHNPKVGPKTKDKADLLEAFLGALYVEKNLVYCHTFCAVTLFPRLREFIMNQEWNDPKSKLQQCCLTLRTMDGSEPDIPIYKVIECVGPTNTRVYTVAVYFRGERLSSARGHYIQEAEMNAAKAALANSKNLFPQLDHQKRVIAKSMKQQKRTIRNLKHKMKYPPGFKEGSSDGEADKDSDRGSKRKRPDKAAKAKEKAKLYLAPLKRRLEKLPKAYRLNRSSDSSEDENFLSDVSLSYLSSESDDGIAYKKNRVRREKSISELSVTEGNVEDAVGEDSDIIGGTIECDPVGDTVKRDKVKYYTVKGGTVKGGTVKGDTVTGDTAKRDTVKGDTFKGDTSKGDTSKGDTSKGDTAKQDTIKEDTAKQDTIKGDTVKGVTVKRDAAKEYPSKHNTVKGDAIKRDTAKGDAIKRDTAKGDPIKRDTAKRGAVKEDPIKRDTAKKDAVRGDTVRGDRVEGLNDNETVAAMGCIL